MISTGRCSTAGKPQPCARCPEANSSATARECPRKCSSRKLPFRAALLEDAPRDELERAPIRIEMSTMNEWYRDLDRVGGAHHLIVLRDRDDARRRYHRHGIAARPIASTSY